MIWNDTIAVTDFFMVLLLFSAIVLAAGWARKTRYDRKKGSREVRYTARVWIAFAIYILVMVITLLWTPLSGREFGVLAICLLGTIGLAALLAYSMSASWLRWDRDAITWRVWPMKPSRLEWDDVTEASVKYSIIRFRAGKTEVGLPSHWPGAGQFARYARCRLKNNPRVVWSV